MNNLSFAKSHIEERMYHFLDKGNLYRYNTMRKHLDFLNTRKRMSKRGLEVTLTLGIDFEPIKSEYRIIYT